MQIFLNMDWRIGFMREVIGAIKRWEGWPEAVSFRMDMPRGGITQRRQLHHWDADGTICVLKEPISLSSLRHAVPHLVNLEWTEDGQRAPDVGIDRDALCRLAIDHLLTSGFTSVAYYGWELWLPRASVREAADRSGVPVSCFHMDTHRAVPRGVSVWDTQDEQIVEWLADLPPGTGVICDTDLDAIVIADRCQDIGRKVPDDLGILGIGDDPICRDISQPALSSIRLPAQAIGIAAAERLCQQITSATSDLSPRLFRPTDIVHRASTHRALAEYPEIREAIRLIQQHATTGITVSDVVDHVAISRTGLEKKMRDAIGRTPAQEIERVRMAIAQQLLTDSVLPIGQIAGRCGFSLPEHFTRAFARVHGMPPTAYRRQLREAIPTPAAH